MCQIVTKHNRNRWELFNFSNILYIFFLSDKLQQMFSRVCMNLQCFSFCHFFVNLDTSMCQFDPEHKSCTQYFNMVWLKQKNILMSLYCDHLTVFSPTVRCLTAVACGSLRHLHKWMCPCSAAWRTVWLLRRTNGGSAVWSRRSWSSVANYKVSVMSYMSCVLLGYFLWEQSHKVSSLPG